MLFVSSGWNYTEAVLQSCHGVSFHTKLTLQSVGNNENVSAVKIKLSDLKCFSLGVCSCVAFYMHDLWAMCIEKSSQSSQVLCSIHALKENHTKLVRIVQKLGGDAGSTN